MRNDIYKQNPMERTDSGVQKLSKAVFCIQIIRMSSRFTGWRAESRLSWELASWCALLWSNINSEAA